MTWNQAKKRIWDENPTPKGWTPDNIWTADMYERAAELYARNLANEKVRDVKLKLISAGLYELDGAGYFPATQLIEELPLPFPAAK